MQVDEAPRLCPQPTGAEQRNGGPRCAEGVELLFAPVLSGQGAGCAEENMDAAQVERQIGHVPLTGVQQDGLLHKLIGQHQDKHSAKDLMDGKEIAVQNGSTGQEALEKLLGKNHPSIKKTPMSIQMLIGGQVDALVGDETSVKSIQAQYPEAHLSIVYDDEAFTPEFFGILYPKDTGAELKSKIDKVLKDMIADGTYGKIYEKWFKTKVDEETLEKLGNR